MEIEQLVKRAKKGDEQAFFQLISSQKAQIYRVAYAYLKREQDALEAVQEVTYRAYKEMEKLREPLYFSTWVIRITINYCNTELKKRKRVTVKPDVGLSTPIRDNDLALEIKELLDSLDEQCQQVIILKYFQGMKLREIAEVMERPEGTIKTWLNRALGQLRKELDENGGVRHV